MQSKPRPHEGSGDNNQIDWNAAFNTQQRPLRRLAVRLVGESRADDVVQETFLRAYRARSSFVDGSAAYPWLSKIARRVAIDMLRRDEVAARVEQQLAIEPPNPDSVDDVMTNGIRRRAINEALSALTERQRRLLVEVELGEGAPASPIGSDVAVKSVLARARRNFRERYAAIAGKNGVFAGSATPASTLGRIREAATRWRALAERAELAVAGVAVVSALMADGVVLGAASVVPGASGSALQTQAATTGGNEVATLGSPSAELGSDQVDAAVTVAAPGDSPATAGGVRVGNAEVSWETHSDGHTGRLHVRATTAVGYRTEGGLNVECAVRDTSKGACEVIGAVSPYIPQDRQVGKTWEQTGADASADLPS